MNICIYKCVDIYVCICMYMYVYVCICYIYICIYICIVYTCSIVYNDILYQIISKVIRICNCDSYRNGFNNEVCRLSQHRCWVWACCELKVFQLSQRLSLLVRMCTCTCIYLYVCDVRASVYVYIYIYIHMNIYIYIYIYIYYEVTLDYISNIDPQF